MRDYGISMVAPSSSQDAPPSMEVIDHNIQTLKRLMGQLELIRKDTESFTAEQSDDLRLPKEVVRFHTRKELVNGATNSCRDRRDFRRAVYGIPEASAPEGRPGHAIRNSTGHPFTGGSRLSVGGKRLHLVVGYGHLEDDMPDVDPLTDLYTRRLFYRYFGHELDRSKRHGYTVSLMYFTLKNWQDVAQLHYSPSGKR